MRHYGTFTPLGLWVQSEEKENIKIKKLNGYLPVVDT